MTTSVLERKKIRQREIRLIQAERRLKRRAAAAASSVTDEEIEAFHLDTWEWEPHQEPPPDEWFENITGTKEFYLFGGRGSGKTWGGVRHFYEHMTGPPCSDELENGHSGVIVAPSLADALRSVYDRPSGMKSVDPRVEVKSPKGGTVMIFPNGAEAAVIGLPNKPSVDRLRAAGGTCCAYLEEFAAIPHLGAAMDHLRIGVRMGSKRIIIGSSTPKPRPAVRKMINHPKSFVRTGSTADNPHLDDDYREEIYERFRGTSVEAQELDGKLLDHVQGALWSFEGIAQRRIIPGEVQRTIPQEPGESYEEWIVRALGITRLAVCVDPATSGRGDETGLVVVGVNAGKRKRRQAFVLEDATELLGVEAWRDKAAMLCEKWKTPLIIVEKNRLGDTARLVLQDLIPNARIHALDAVLSKGMRADPVAGRWSSQCWMVGTHTKLENQMTNWIPADGDDPDLEADVTDPESFRGSPDAIDAMVHGITELLGLSMKKRGATGDVSGALEAGWGN